MSPYKHAIELLKRACTPLGIVSTVTPERDDAGVYTRNAVISGIAGLLTRDETIIEGFKASLRTILSNQHPSGFIPNFVSENEVSYGGKVGATDNHSWAILGLCLYTRLSGDTTLKEEFLHQVEQSIDILEALELNGQHLVYVPQGGNWADGFMAHGYLLFDQLLRYAALREASVVFENETLGAKAELIRNAIEINYWNDGLEAGTDVQLNEPVVAKEGGYWQLGFNPSRVYTYFDQVANAFAILLQMGSDAQQASVAQQSETMMQETTSLLPCLNPFITIGDADMRDLSHNYGFQFHNYPGQFHNGGLWPVWNGSTVAALKFAGKEYAALHLQYRLEHACAANHYSFNECLDATTGMQIGVNHSTRSAAGLIIGKKALEGSFSFFP